MKTKTIIICITLFAISCAASTFPLMNAASKGDIQTSQRLIRNGADINEKDRSGSTPLMMALCSGKPEAAKMFIEMGADIKTKDSRGYSPLMHAVEQSQYDIAKLLIDKHASVNDRDLYDETPLSIAASKSDVSMVKLLIDNGADVNAKNYFGMTALHYAAQYYEPEKSYNVAKILIENGTDLSLKDNYGKTPLKYALDSKMIDTVALIRTKYQENDDLTGISLDDALKVPSRINPEQGTFLIPRGKEKAYSNAIYDCNDLIIPRKTVLLFATAGVGYGVGLAIDAVTVQGKFQRCMEKMGFKCVKNCSK